MSPNDLEARITMMIVVGVLLSPIVGLLVVAWGLAKVWRMVTDDND